MFMRWFVYADQDEEALKIYHDSMKMIWDSILEIQQFTIESYWKFSDMYVIEVSLKLDIDREMFRNFLESISDSWEKCGLPMDEIIASDTTSGCQYMISGVGMLNIFFEDTERYGYRYKRNFQSMEELQMVTLVKNVSCRFTMKRHKSKGIV